MSTASLAGVIQEAGRHDCIGEIYGGVNGILGILDDYDAGAYQLGGEDARCLWWGRTDPQDARHRLGACRTTELRIV